MVRQGDRSRGLGGGDQAETSAGACFALPEVGHVEDGGLHINGDDARLSQLRGAQLLKPALQANDIPEDLVSHSSDSKKPAASVRRGLEKILRGRPGERCINNARHCT